MPKLTYYFIIFFIIITGSYLAVVIFLNNVQTSSVVESLMVEPPEQELEAVIPLENREAKVPILIYHHIRQLRGEDATSTQQFIIFPENFENQIKYLQNNNFTSIALNDLANYFEGSFTLPDKPIIITFDDGTISQYENAFPILQKYNMTATFFIFSNPIGQSKNYMTWEQLTEMDKAGMEIGNHGWYHLYLGRISQAELEREIIQSKQRLEEKLDHEVDIFAYPFGSYNDEVIKAVKNVGYRAARDIINGVNHTQDDLYNLRGYFVTNSFSRFTNIVSQ